MSEESVDNQTPEPEATEEAVKAASRPIKPISPARALGRIAGAGVAISTAAVVFVVAGLMGVPTATAATRSVIAAAIMWLVVGFAVRFLFAFVIRDWKNRLVSRPPEPEATS